MIFKPACVVKLLPTGIHLISDHRHSHCGNLFKFTDEHTDAKVIEMTVEAAECSDITGMAIHDLQAFLASCSGSVLEREVPKERRRAFRAALQCLFEDLGQSTFEIGTELDPVTLEPSYYLVISGLQQYRQVPLTPVHRGVQ